ncbi:hypothetical protein D7036_12105 [Aquimarina sp. BL5]|uniref:hypothetical protein n=1 Tax=Aquimarina sp. BL5 TaxID=1714860 RepID=UPI000EAA0CF0|nr:hypothetical protein [Aquimarina sp. BL5]RKN04550.1 hypothetical protein D7036_12105 [Aquimarina sp. BL5]
MKNLTYIQTVLIKHSLIVLFTIFYGTQLLAQVSPQERQALIDLYNATDGDNWTSTINGTNPWLVNDASSLVNTWGGVTVEDNKVIGIYLFGGGVAGQLPNSIGDLVHLRSLVITRSGGLTGGIPSTIGNLTQLESINLSSNQLTEPIPVELGNLTKLTGINLYRNRITGTIPSSLGNLINLIGLTLGENALSGSIPSELGNLTNLTGLNLFQNQLTGTIPSSIGNLTNLTSLALARNGLTGGIPISIVNLTKITGLDLSSNKLSDPIPPELGNMTNLTGLNLYRNRITGSIPKELANLTNLVGLTLGENALTGSIPPELGSLTNLTGLNLFQNQLTGSIPPELGNLQNLVGLTLGRNSLTGPIPAALGNLTNLESLDLGTNRLTSIAPELGNLTKLKSLILYINQITSPIPSEIGNLTNLETFTVERNAITGSIPSELGNLKKLKSLSFSRNQLTGSIPESIGQLTDLQGLGVSYNNLSGKVPSGLATIVSNGVLKGLGLERNKFVFSDFEAEFQTYRNDLTNFNYLLQDKVDEVETLSVSQNESITLTSLALTSPNNSYQWFKNNVAIPGATNKDLVIANATDSDAGVYHFTATNSIITDLTLTRNSITVEIGCGVSASEKQALIDLYNSTDGVNWRYSTNWLTDAPVCDWYGVTVSNGKVTKLSLALNGVAGPLPNNFSDLIHLESVTFERNALTGTIPSSIGNMTNLTFLHLGSNQLTGEIPASIGNLTNLTALSLYRNGLTGSIPSELGNLTNLETLHLFSNGLTGVIPASFGNLTKLKILMLYINRLEGPLPSELGNLSALENLSFERNVITGPIPTSFGNLISLKELNLGNNQLSGSIPSELGNLSSLIGLRLFWNRLEGEIPSELSNISNLEIISLTRNLLTGEIPSSLGTITSLKLLDVSINNITGTVPASIGQLTNLNHLGLTQNKLSGRIPPELESLTTSDVLNVLGLQQNNFVFSDFETEFQTYKNDLTTFNYLLQDKVDEVETLSVTENGTITLTSTALTSPNNSYQWYRDGVLIPGAINKDLVITNAKESDAGIYHFTATNSIVTDLTLERNPITLTVEENICGVSESEKQALLDLYNATNGDSWSNTLASNKPWDENISVCDWYGVTVVDGKVVGLNLENNVVSGTIPSSISNLIYLTNLDLNTNALIGEIPSSMGALLELTYLSMHHNSLTGNLPPSLGSLSNLTVMDLGFNVLQGPIPIAFCNLSNLEILNLSNNQLSGSIPKELGILKKLRRINLQYNFFTNVIPSQLVSLSNLEYLALNNNILSGVIPFTATEFSRLESFLFENNKFIFSDFENKHIGYKDFINTIYQYSPQAKTDAVETKTVTTGNTITLTTVLSSENNNYQWFKGDVLIPSATSREYSITNATIEDAGDYYFKATNNVIDGLTLERNVVTLNVVNNCEVSTTERQALEALYTSTNGTNWTNTLAENQSWLINDSDSAICDWYGVVVEDNKVVELNLSNNNLQGILPDIFNGLPYLKKIRFDGNILSGEIPVSFSAIAGLDILAIENNRFIFSDIETGSDNYVLKLGNEFTYIPQDMVDDENTVRVTQGESVTLTTIQLTSNANTYQWFKNGLPIDGATNKEYTITNATIEDQAVYFFEATNTIVDDLILMRRAIKIEVVEEGDTCRVSESEKQALIDLYNSTNGPNWTNNTNWLTDAPVCDWYGVTVVEGKVISLSLVNNNLDGILTPSISNLNLLTELILNSNRKLLGSLPLELMEMINLERLALSSCNLSGNIPEEIGNLLNLEELYLGYNNFSGTIPLNISILSKLRVLAINSNDIEGTIPDTINNLSNLETLDLFSNELEGQIPDSIVDLVNLKLLRLFSNKLEGIIPEQIGKLINLNQLQLGNNRLVGTIPVGITNLLELTNFNIFNNQIEGTIPADIGNLSLLTELVLAQNKLEGTIPDSISNLQELSNLNIYSNSLNGKIPSGLTSLLNWTHFLFSSNNFVFSDFENEHVSYTNQIANQYAYFPQKKVDEIETKSIVSGQSVTLTSNDLTSTNNRYQWFKTVNGSTTEIPGATNKEYTIENVAETDAGIYHFTATNSIVTDLTLTRNPITLEVLEAGACAVSDEDRQALIDFYQTTNGDAWVNTVNGSQPWLINDPTSKVCDWFGVTISSDYKVESIQLPGNNLRGEIPTSLEVLKDLKVLDLSQNSMIGEIPVILGNMPNLESLNLRENVLVGAIPEAITNITSLQTLDLGLNRFSSVIPTTIGELQALTYLDLSENKLEGTIPESLYTSLSLEVIKFQKNNLSGGVSGSIGDLVNLEVFWLSENNFSGAIPSSITSIPGLYNVHLDANAFGSDLPLLIPNFALANTEVQINSNRFVFSDFENEHPQYRDNLTNYTYIPQAKVDRVETIIVELGGSARLFTDDLTSPNNMYRWYKGQDFFVETQLREITIDNITEADLGDYYFVATNSTIEGLVLERNRITLKLRDITPPDGGDCDILEGVVDGSFENCYDSSGIIGTTTQNNDLSCSGFDTPGNFMYTWKIDPNNQGTSGGILSLVQESPDGGAFASCRVDQPQSQFPSIILFALQKEITEIEIGAEYEISFYQSNGGYSGATSEFNASWRVSWSQGFGSGSSENSPDMLVKGGLVGNNSEAPTWDLVKMRFTAASSSMNLTFTPVVPAHNTVDNGVLVHLLIDGIKVTKVDGDCGDTTSDYEFCLSQDSPTIADLTSPITGTNMVSWYELETGGEPLPLDEEITENFTYWADDNLGNPRVSVDVDVYGGFIGYDNLEDYDYQSFAVITDPKISDLQSPGENITWYSAAVGGIQYNDSDPLVNGSSYYAQQGTSPCRFEVSVFVGVFPPLGDGWQFFCKSTDPTLNSIELADLDAGYSYRWYNQEIGGSALDTTIGLLDGDIYFVTIVDPEGNESERRQIEVSVYDIPPPVVTRTHQVFYSNDPVTVSELIAVGNNIIWYDANGIAFDPETHLDESVTYYAGQTDLNCKEGDINCCVSTERIAVTVEILEELPPSLIGCERFRPQPGDHYVISAWVREDGLLATNPEVKPFSAVSNSFVKLLEHLYEDVLVGNKSIPAIYKVDNRQLDDLIPFIVNSVDKNLTVYNFKPYKRKQDNEGPERTVGFEFSLIPGNNAPVYRYQTPFVVENGNNQKNYRYPLSHNSEVLDLKFKDVIVTGNTLKIISDFSITGAPYSLTRTNIENNTNAAGIQSEITTFTFISDPDYQAMKYMNSSMRLIFKSGDPVASEDELEEIQNIEFTPKGALIDGWQRVSADFVIPLDAINMTISLESNIRQGSPESLNVYFDDIRIHPFEGNMKTFVYDPITQRLQAELDENNYATFYEYDQEGGLIRVKKETERGVYTIQETRSGNAKRTN